MLMSPDGTRRHQQQQNKKQHNNRRQTIATKLELDDNIDVTALKQASITLKDHTLPEQPNIQTH